MYGNQSIVKQGGHSSFTYLVIFNSDMLIIILMINKTIIKGLKYLNKKQNKNGSFGRKDASKTGLALLAFSSLSKYPDLIEEYKPSAERAVQWFLSNQRRNGTWPGGFHPFDVIDTAFSIWGINKFLEIFIKK